MSQDQTNNVYRQVLILVVVVVCVIFVYLLATSPTVKGTYTGIVIDKYEWEYYIGSVKQYDEYYILLDSGEDYKISKFIYYRIKVGNWVKIKSLSDGSNSLSKIER